MSDVPDPPALEECPQAPSSSAPPALSTTASETRVISTVSSVFLVLGVFAGVLFLQDANVARHPQTFLLAVTGVFGSVILRVLARLLGNRPVD